MTFLEAVRWLTMPIKHSRIEELLAILHRRVRGVQRLEIHSPGKIVTFSGKDPSNNLRCYKSL